jgi:uncharacterized protein YchJ
MLRRFIDSDGNDESLLDNLPFDERLARHEAGDNGQILNEEFVNALMANYFKVCDGYHPANMTREDKDKINNRFMRLAQFTLAVFRNDSAYFERMGGVIQFVVNNRDRFQKITAIDQEHSNLIEGVRRWWYENDKRKRTHFWIDWVFRYVIRKYKTDMFMRRSINMALIFITANANSWQFDESYDPRMWFPAYRGKFANAMFKGNF